MKHEKKLAKRIQTSIPSWEVHACLAAAHPLGLLPRGWINRGDMWLIALLLLALVGGALALARLLRGFQGGAGIDARYDPQTGVYDRSTGEHLIRRMIHRNRSQRMALILLRVSDFAALTERVGEEAAGLLLRALGERLRQQVPGQAVVCRALRDGFMICMRIEGDVESLRQAIGRLVDDGLGDQMNVYVNVGVAVMPDNGMSFPLLLEKADMALFWAERGGQGEAMFYREAS